MSETLKGQAPLFGGSTGGLLTKALVEERYAITWSSPKEQVFEMPISRCKIPLDRSFSSACGAATEFSAIALNSCTTFYRTNPIHQRCANASNYESLLERLALYSAFLRIPFRAQNRQLDLLPPER